MTVVHLFGAARVVYAQVGDIGPLGRKTWELLALLVATPSVPRTRSELADALWPDRPERQARSSLNTEVWRLREAFKGADCASAAQVISAADDAVAICPGEKFSVDACALESVVAEALAAREARPEPELLARLVATLGSCRGPYLHGHDADWVLIERERLHAVRVRGLFLVMEAHERRGAYADAVNWALQLLSEDPLHERAHRDLIRLLALDGRRCEAIDRYRRLEAMLAEELGVEPMPETQALRNRILSGTPLSTPRAAG